MRRHVRALALLVALGILGGACRGGGTGAPRHREHDPSRDRECKDPSRPRAYFYAAEDRTYTPDDPVRDRCALLVADHLFCCPDAPRPTDR